MATIQIDEHVESLLKATAASRRVSPDTLAAMLLRDALNPEDADWCRLNERRIELIRKSRQHGLSPSETRDLQELQDVADQRAEQSDQAMLDLVRNLRDEVEALPRRNDEAHS